MRTIPNAFQFAASAWVSALVGKRVLNCLWELTYRCNAKCCACNYWRHPSPPEDELTLADIRHGLDKIYDCGCRVVNFTGGEPTLRSDLEDIVEHASHLGMWTSLVTNGSLLTRERMASLKKAGLDNLFVSLDSTDAEMHDEHRQMKGLYSRVRDCLHWLSEDFLTGHRTGGVMCVLSSFNTHLVDEVVSLADPLGFYVVFQPYHQNKTGSGDFLPNIGVDMTEKIVKLKRERKNILNSEGFIRGFGQQRGQGVGKACHAGRKYFSIDPYGYLHPCVDLPSAGHLLRDNVEVVRSSQALQDVNACEGCWYFFRGEADNTLSILGCLEKFWLGLTVIVRNEHRRLMISRRGDSKTSAE